MGLDGKTLFSRQIGTGGSNEPLEVITHGKKRMQFEAGQPAVTGVPVTATPSAPTEVGAGTWFFRNNGAGKSQFCVVFPSGAVQVIATEP